MSKEKVERWGLTDTERSELHKCSSNDKFMTYKKDTLITMSRNGRIEKQPADFDAHKATWRNAKGDAIVAWNEVVVDDHGNFVKVAQ